MFHADANTYAQKMQHGPIYREATASHAATFLILSLAALASGAARERPATHRETAVINIYILPVVIFAMSFTIHYRHWCKVQRDRLHMRESPGYIEAAGQEESCAFEIPYARAAASAYAAASISGATLLTRFSNASMPRSSPIAMG